MSALYALLSRMRHIVRWSLMRNTIPEDIQQHSHQCATIAHCLALIHNRKFGGNVNADRVAVLALYHDAGEVITGDLPTPIKNHSPQLHDAYKQVEHLAEERLLDMAPDCLKPDYAPLFHPQPEDAQAWKLVKGADRLCAYLKCVEERRAGNREFEKAEERILAAIRAEDMPEVNWFLEEFGPSFRMTIDELNG